MLIGVNRWLKFQVFVFFFSVLFFLPWPNASSARESHFTILFTNDHLGQVEPISQVDSSKPVGGVSRRMALIEKIRKEVGPDHLVLVDGGGLFGETPFSQLTRGEVDCAAYQLMQYDAIVIGEHDFDYGIKSLPDYRKQFKTPWVSANLVRGGQPFLRPYFLKLSGGVRVGLIGFSNPETPALVGREKLRGLVFNPPGAAAKGLHSIFKKDADIFVVLSRLGVEGDKKLAKDNSFLHVIVGGFSQTLLTEPIATKAKDGRLVGPIIVQAGSRGLYLGRLDLTVAGHRDPKTKNAEYSIVDYHNQLIPITADLPEDPQMTALLQRYKNSLRSKQLDEVLATALGDLSVQEGGNTLWGELAADAIRQKAQSEIALVNNGSFRGDFKSGDITREVLYETYPSDDEIVVMDVPGVYLKKILAASFAQKGQGGFLQVSGLKIEKAGEDLQVTVGDEPLNDRRKYLVAVNDFLATGGGGYDLLRRVKSRRKTGWMVRGLLEEALKEKQKLSPAEIEKRWNIP